MLRKPRDGGLDEQSREAEKDGREVDAWEQLTQPHDACREHVIVDKQVEDDVSLQLVGVGEVGEQGADALQALLHPRWGLGRVLAWLLHDVSTHTCPSSMARPRMTS